MTDSGNYRHEIHRYEHAATAYTHWCRHATGRPPALDRAALLTMICVDLATGPAALIVGPHGRDLVADLRRTLGSGAWREVIAGCAASPDPVEACRAAWMLDSMARLPSVGDGIRIYVAVSDPVPGGYPVVETRILVDGVPIVAAAFDRGRPAQPEYLLEAGRLAATDISHEVRLAEAYCTEGCCGALYVTIVRDGAEVVWSGWRGRYRGEPPKEFRFEAADYDTELRRAGQDHIWEWPARTVARLLQAELQTDPNLLGRWGCRLGWCSAWQPHVDEARLTFGYPATVTSPDEPHVQFGLVIDVDPADPDRVVADIVDRLRTTDPKTYAEIVGGSRDGAAQLGLVHREPTRWKAST